MSFSPANEFEALIHAGNGVAVLDHLESLSREEREAMAGRLDEISRLMQYWWWKRDVVHDTWGMVVTDAQRDAIGVASLVCAPSLQAARFRLPAARVAEVAQRFRPDSLGTLSSDFARTGHIAAALQLATEGLSAYELDEDAVVRMIALARTTHPLREYLLHNSAVLGPVLLRMFEVEGTTEINLAGVDKYSGREEQTWSWNLLRLCEDGLYSRDQLLVGSLATLERDWPQFRAGWFSRFHDALAPAPEEMAPHAARYLGLLQSRIPPTVTLALKACSKLFDKKLVAGEELIDGLPPVMLSAVKAQITAALKILDTMVKRDPACAHAASRVAISGLQHTDPDVQGSIIERIGKWGMDEEGRAHLQGMAPYVTASMRPALEALQPVAGQDGQSWGEIVLPARACGMSPIDPSRALSLPAALDDLVALCARLLEDESDVDLFEVAFGALLAARPFGDADRARFTPVIKRARKLKANLWDLKACLSGEFARFLLAVVAGEHAECPHSRGGALGILAERIEDASGFDVATHRGGFIDPSALVQRAGALGGGVAKLPLRVQVRALLRLAPGAGSAALAAAQALPDTAFRQALCYALGGEWPQHPDQALCLAAARIRHPGADDALAMLVFGDDLPDGARAAQCELHSELVKWDGGEYSQPKCEVQPAPMPVDSTLLAPYRHVSFWQHAESLILFGASLFPSSHEAMWADALPGLAENLQCGEAEWHHGAWLRVLGEPTTQMTPAAAMTLALALMGKDPGRLARAVDAFVTSGTDGRLDAAGLGRAFLALVPQDYFMAGRLAGSMATAAAAHPGMPAVVLAVLGVLCELPPGEVPRDMAKLLQLMHELVLQQRLRLGADVKAALQRAAFTGKANTIRRTILSIEEL